MGFLKGLGLSILGFLLFLSLSAFGFLFLLDNTLLDRDFIGAEMSKLDKASLVREMVSTQIPQGDPLLSGLAEQVASDTIQELEPWIDEQTSFIAVSFHDYLTGEKERLNIVVSLVPLRESLNRNMREAVLETVPPQHSFIPPEIELVLNEANRQIDELIPSSLEINEALIGPDGMDILEQARQWMHYAQTAYGASIIVTLLLILAIVLIYRQVRGATRSIGAIFLTYGVIEYASIFIIKRFALPQMLPMEMPAALQQWLPQFYGDLLAPLEMLGLATVAIGVVLLIVSFVYPKRETTADLTATG